MSANSKTALNLINERIALAEKHMANDEANEEFTAHQKQLNANYYRGAINHLTVVRNQIEATLTWRDK